MHSDKKKSLDIAKAIPVHINSISIETDMEVFETKKYTIIVDNKWLKKAKALFNYELSELNIKCNEKPIVVKYHHWTIFLVSKQNQEDKQLDKLDDDEKETAKLTYIIFISNGKPLDNVKADREKIIVNNKLICWPYYDILRKIFDRKLDKKTKYSYWWHGPCAQY
ncbi:hypothetical protein G9A89_023629 [Geosiphon pyriformis]|nr:hypothetical protein G9A89_023629 [Geosiphon pyriformis]